MSSFDGPLVAFKQVLAHDLAAGKIRRAGRRAQWDFAVKDASVRWREFSGYKMPPIIDRRLIDREAREMVALVMKARLLMMFAPLFVMAEHIDRSVHIISILASPSGAGPKRYAPKQDGAERISVNQ